MNQIRTPGARRKTLIAKERIKARERLRKDAEEMMQRQSDQFKMELEASKQRLAAYQKHLEFIMERRFGIVASEPPQSVHSRLPHWMRSFLDYLSDRDKDTQQ